MQQQVLSRPADLVAMTELHAVPQQGTAVVYRSGKRLQIIGSLQHVRRAGAQRSCHTVQCVSQVRRWQYAPRSSEQDCKLCVMEVCTCSLARRKFIERLGSIQQCLSCVGVSDRACQRLVAY
jgi:hypothetical protein